MNGNGTGKAVGAIINKTKQKRSVTGLEDRFKKFTQISLITVG